MIHIILKLHASLTRFLPDGTNDHQITLNLPDTSKILDACDQLHMPLEPSQLVMINGVFIPPSKRTQHILKDGDELAIWPPITGG